MYRILAEDHPIRERRNQLTHPVYTKPELVATAPDQTWSWDITRLLGPRRSQRDRLIRACTGPKGGHPSDPTRVSDVEIVESVERQ